MVTEGQTVTMTCGGGCQLSTNTTVSWYMNNQLQKTQQNQNKLVLKAVTSHQEGNYFCVVTFGNNSIKSHVLTLNIVSLTMIHKSAAAIGAGAAVLVTIPVVVFIWFRWATFISDIQFLVWKIFMDIHWFISLNRTKRTSGQSSTTEGTDNREQVKIKNWFFFILCSDLDDNSCRGIHMLLCCFCLENYYHTISTNVVCLLSSLVRPWPCVRKHPSTSNRAGWTLLQHNPLLPHCPTTSAHRTRARCLYCRQL